MHGVCMRQVIMVYVVNKTCTVCVCNRLYQADKGLLLSVSGHVADNKTQLLGKSNTVHSLLNSCLSPIWQVVLVVVAKSDN